MTSKQFEKLLGKYCEAPDNSCNWGDLFGYLISQVTEVAQKNKSRLSDNGGDLLIPLVINHIKLALYSFRSYDLNLPKELPQVDLEDDPKNEKFAIAVNGYAALTQAIKDIKLEKMLLAFSKAPEDKHAQEPFINFIVVFVDKVNQEIECAKDSSQDEIAGPDAWFNIAIHHLKILLEPLNVTEIVLPEYLPDNIPQTDMKLVSGWTVLGLVLKQLKEEAYLKSVIAKLDQACKEYQKHLSSEIDMLEKKFSGAVVRIKGSIDDVESIALTDFPSNILMGKKSAKRDSLQKYIDRYNAVSEMRRCLKIEEENMKQKRLKDAICSFNKKFKRLEADFKLEKKDTWGQKFQEKVRKILDKITFSKVKKFRYPIGPVANKEGFFAKVRAVVAADDPASEMPINAQAVGASPISLT